MSRALVSWFAALTLAAVACSSPPDAEPPPGDGSGSGPVRIYSVTPDDGATGVSGWSPITVQLSDVADAGSINGDTVRVYYGDTRVRVLGQISIGEYASSFTFMAAAPFTQVLGDGWQPMSFRVEIDGVTAKGVPIARRTTHFWSYFGPPLYQRSYSGDVLTSSYAWEHDGSGRITAFVVQAPGPDGRLDTGDDGIDHYRAFHYTPGDVAIVEYGQPGADGVWRTDDDVISGWGDVTYNAAGERSRSVSYDDPGPDGAWRTADDHALSYEQRGYDEVDRVTTIVDGRPGADGVIGTADDVISSAQAMRYTGSLPLPTDTITYVGPGPDGVWLTGDDEILSDRRTTYDDDGVAVEAIDIAPGADGRLDTGDDERFGATSYQPQWELVASDPGPDHAWGTADDPTAYGYYTETDAHLTRIRRDRVTSGLDGLLGTPYDHVLQSTVYDGSR